MTLSEYIKNLKVTLAEGLAGDEYDDWSMGYEAALEQVLFDLEVLDKDLIRKCHVEAITVKLNTIELSRLKHIAKGLGIKVEIENYDD